MTAGVPVPLHGGVPAALADRVLLQVGHRRSARYRDWVDGSCSGLVLTGEGALAKAGQLRGEGFEATLVVDEARYRAADATREAPFPGVDDGPAPLFGDPLEHLLLAQLAFADVGLTPTGYLPLGAAEALEAAASRVARLGDPRVVFAVPMDAGWLYPGALEHLAEVLCTVPGPKAVMVGGRPDPWAAAAGQARLLELVPGTGVLRSGLGAFGSLGYGAGFTAFGMDGSMRHLPPPVPVQEPSAGGPGSPVVLFPDLMGFFLGQTLAKRFDDQAPTCSCGQCRGEPLDRFLSMAQQVPAAGHNAAVLMEWVRELQSVEARARGRWWRERCRRALGEYEVWNGVIGQKRGFAAPADLSVWAELAVRHPAGEPVG
jgi:hypothetical protein